MTLLNKLKILYNEYPRQYWLMITGVVISTAGGSMIWPFLLIYASSTLDMPLSTVATLISINAGTGLLSSLIAGSLADKIGRKVVIRPGLLRVDGCGNVSTICRTDDNDWFFKPALSGRCRRDAG
jgi:MFS family permease